MTRPCQDLTHPLTRRVGLRLVLQVHGVSVVRVLKAPAAGAGAALDGFTAFRRSSSPVVVSQQEAQAEAPQERAQQAGSSSEPSDTPASIAAVHTSATDTRQTDPLTRMRELSQQPDLVPSTRPAPLSPLALRFLGCVHTRCDVGCHQRSSALSLSLDARALLKSDTVRGSPRAGGSNLRAVAEGVPTRGVRAYSSGISRVLASVLQGAWWFVGCESTYPRSSCLQ